MSLSAAVSAGDTLTMAAECQPWTSKPIAKQRKQCKQVTGQWRTLIWVKEEHVFQNLRTKECAINYSLQNSGYVSDRFGMCFISHTRTHACTPQGFFFFHQQIDIGLGNSLLRTLNQLCLLGIGAKGSEWPVKMLPQLCNSPVTQTTDHTLLRVLLKNSLNSFNCNSTASENS